MSVAWTRTVIVSIVLDVTDTRWRMRIVSRIRIVSVWYSIDVSPLLDEHKDAKNGGTMQ